MYYTVLLSPPSPPHPHIIDYHGHNKKPFHQLVTCRLHAKYYNVCPLRLFPLIFLNKNKSILYFTLFRSIFQKMMEEEKSKNRILLGSLQSLYVETVQDTDIKISVKQLVQGWKEACITPQVI